MRSIVRLSLLVALLAGGCGGGGGGGGVLPPAVLASFAASPTATGPNLVWLRERSRSGATLVLDVAVGGPSTSPDIWGFVFDLVLSDPTIARYEANTIVAGDALAAPVLVEAAAQSNDASRIVVGAVKQGASPGNQVAQSSATVVRLTFTVLKAGTTQLQFGGPVAIDHLRQPIGTIAFDPAAASLTGS